MEETFEDNQKP